MKFNYKNIKNISISASVLFHIALLVAFLFLNFTIEYPAKQYVELSFGTSGQPGSSGNIGTQVNQIEQLSKEQKKSEATNTNNEVKKVKLPEAKNTSDENIIKPRLFSIKYLIYVVGDIRKILHRNWCVL